MPVPNSVGPVRCNRCNAKNAVGRFLIKNSYESDLCGECAGLTQATHPIDLVEEFEQALVIPPEEPEEEEEESPWVHTGGGYYEHRETGERRRGKPEAEEPAESGGEAEAGA